MSDLKALSIEAKKALDQGHCAEAERLFMSAFELDPSDLSHLVNVGRAMTARGAWKEALELFQLVTELAQNTHLDDKGILYRELAECYYQLKHMAQWLETAQQCVL